MAAEIDSWRPVSDSSRVTNPSLIATVTRVSYGRDEGPLSNLVRALGSVQPSPCLQAKETQMDGVWTHWFFCSRIRSRNAGPIASGSALWLLVLAPLVIWGCGTQERPPVPGAPPKMPGSINLGEPSDPVAPMERLIASYREGRLDGLWEYLPPTYRRQLTLLCTRFTADLDEATWTATQPVARSLSRSLREQATLWQQSPLKGQLLLDQLSTDDDLRQRQLQAMTTFLDRLGDPQRVSWQQLRTPVVDQLIRELLNPAFGDLQVFIPELKQAVEDMENVTCHARNVNQVQATVELRSADPAVPPRQVDLIVVDGQWVPVKIVSQWTELMDQIEQQVLPLRPRADPDVVAARIQRLTEANQSVEAMLATTDQAEFDQKLLAASLQLLTVVFPPSQWIPLEDAAAGLTESGSQQPVPPRPDVRVLITVPRALSEAEQDQLLNRLIAKTDQPAAAVYSIVSTGGVTELSLSPVADFDRFVQMIDCGVVERVDQRARQFTLDYQPEAPSPQ